MKARRDGVLRANHSREIVPPVKNHDLAPHGGASSPVVRKELGAEDARTHQAEASIEQVPECAMGLRETLRRGDPRDGKRFLVELTQSIVVKPGEVEIEYRLPGPEKPETEDVASPVLESLLSGGGGGSRTRVRSNRRSASTGLVSRFVSTRALPRAGWLVPSSLGFRRVGGSARARYTR